VTTLDGVGRILSRDHGVYNNLDFLRGVETLLTFVPAASIEGLRRRFIELGVTLPAT
jgi:hypothetical protein